MSLQLIQNYYNQVDRTKQYSGKDNEIVVSPKFAGLLNGYCEKKNLFLCEQVNLKVNGKTIRPDGVIRNSLRLDFGYWESKANVDFDAEINKKIKAGYPLTNTIFEDSVTIILYQNGYEVERCLINDANRLDLLLTKFISIEPKAVKDFNEAVEHFKKDIPDIVSNLKIMIAEQQKSNIEFSDAQNHFLTVCKESINPSLTISDINEMLIQHILTEEIFISIFSDAQFHKENNIAKELYKVEETFFTGSTKRKTLDSIRNYYDIIKARASELVDHHEKQYFLKVIYENFYKSYNVKAADKLGIVYTPNEIVKFMIESASHLLIKHFNKTLSDKNVEILDPCTGTGTFITELIEHHIPSKDLAYKYKNEIHANEVAILPYYIANLNIEYTFKQKMGYFEPFPNICFVDTLDNLGFKGIGKEQEMFSITVENSERIKRQNLRKISVVIGNPPYNANQQNENDNNKNRIYTHFDQRIKETFIKNSTAQKTKAYDMYSRFFRWAMDRVDKNGIIAFITNNSLINARTFDGFRKCIENEFDYAYIIDLGGNIRELSGKDGIWLNENNTIFGMAAAVGVAITFLIKKESKSKEKLRCQIQYIHPCDIRATRKEKIEYLQGIKNFEEINFTRIQPDEKNNWINQSENDFDTLLQLVKNANPGEQLFEKTNMGVSTNRDEWVYDINLEALIEKMKYFIDEYSMLMKKNISNYPNSIKWSRDLKRKFDRKLIEIFNKKLCIQIGYRPFIKRFFYAEKIYVDMLTFKHVELLGNKYNYPNKIISVNYTSSKDFNVLASKYLVDLHFNGDSNCIALYRYDEKGNRIDNITDWGLEQFHKHYEDTKITKQDIFYYTYAVLHNPLYCKKYELNLKRDFPRIPYYNDFYLWEKWGQELAELHINYEVQIPFPLKRIDIKIEKIKQGNLIDTKNSTLVPTQQAKIKVKLKAEKEEGSILIDDVTSLKDVPTEAWDYKIGNRSAIEWVLDQYKESTPSDTTIAEHFNTYKFADYKEHVIDLLMKVCTVSVETMKIIKEMELLES